MQGDKREALAIKYRTEAAVRAAAKAFHENAREKHQFTWDSATPAWRAEMREFVRPLVVAALAAADHFDAMVKSHSEGDSASQFAKRPLSGGPPASD